jgi:glycosyltransferase involved in cell wall biosynthesis
MEPEMSGDGRSSTERRASEAVVKPAVGVVATEGNSDAIVRVIVRANAHGYPVIVICSDGPEAEQTWFTEELDAEALVLDEEGYPIRDALVRRAQALGAPGILLHDDPESYIDYERSFEKFRTGIDYVIEPETYFYSPRSRAPEVLVAVPAYNEASNIAEVVAAAQHYADAVLVVDDGSDDETALAAQRAGAEVVRHDRNSGYGAALKTAFVEADRRRVRHLVILDGDGQHAPEDVPKLIETQRGADADIVIGSRFVEGVPQRIPFYRRFGLEVINLLTNLSLGVVRSDSRVRDTQSGFRAYNRTAIRSLASDYNIGDRMSASTDILYHAHHHDYRIEEVGTTIEYDVEDGSTHNPLAHGYMLTSNILTTIERERPITIVGVPGFASAFFGLGFGYWTISEYIRTGAFPVGLAVISALCILVGVLACFTAVLLHSLNQYHDQSPVKHD